MSLLILFRPSSITVPRVVTLTPTSIDLDSALGNASTSSDTDITRRGFEYGQTPTAEFTVEESGTFAGGMFSLTLTGLTYGTQYYVRAFATNSIGTTYGDWVAFVTEGTNYNITIAGVDRTADVIQDSVVIEDTLNDQVNTLALSLIDLHGNGAPVTDDEVIVQLIDESRIFAGYITKVVQSTKATGTSRYIVSAVEYSRLLDRNLVHKSYQNMTDKEIIEDIVETYCVGAGITTTNVLEGATIDQITFNYIQPSQCFAKLAKLTGRNWYIDYQKDIHYFALTQNVAPFDIDASNTDYSNLQIVKDSSQLKNRIYVRGGTRLSDATTYQEKGDGVKRKFVLPDKPHNVTVTVGATPKTVGIKNIDDSGFDFYLNFQEKYIEQDSGAVVLGTGDTLTVNYQYDIPILVAQENTASIAANGVQEYVIFDKTITTTDAARDRGIAELTDYANDLVEGSFQTYEKGFRTGQYININLPVYDIDDDYIVQKVRAQSVGAGVYVYDVSIASAKTLGIIKFLINLLEGNKNLIEFNDDEVVDELFQLSDSLNSDSLLDSLTIDSAGPYSTWCLDSLDSSPATRARWDLFQWG